MKCSNLEHHEFAVLTHAPPMPGAKLNLCGENVARIRKEKLPPLTQATLAGKVSTHGVKLDRAAIAKIENNLRSVNDLELVALSKALGVTVHNLLGIGS